MSDRSRAHRASARLVIALGGAVALILTALPAGGAQGSRGQPRLQGEAVRQWDLDARGSALAPTAAQRAAARATGASVRWNRFGTPASMIRQKGFLASGVSNDAVAAARTYLLRNRALFRLSTSAVNSLQLLVDAPLGAGHAVLFRQRFGGLAAGHDGLVTLGVRDGKITYVSSSLAGSGNAPARATLSAVDAVLAAARNVGRSVDRSDVSRIRRHGAATTLRLAGFTQRVTAQLVALPTTAFGVRPAFQVVLIDNNGGPLGVMSYVDARTARVLLRDDLVDQETDPSKWKVFRASPSLDFSSADTREVWCWEASGPDCDRVVGNDASPFAWDINARTETSTNTTRGNNAIGVENWFNADPFSVGVNPATPRPGRDYVYDWTNQWLQQRCNPDTTFTSPQRNDIDAALGNLFAMHNRMHDWGYHLGFTETTFNLQDFNFGRGGAENDFEQGNGQAGGVVGGPPNFAARDNANQITPPDGQPPITNMYLWQPIAAGFYAPCVDGDFDMSVIGHEYTHAISNRMVAGPDAGLTGSISRAMGESWSDLDAMEILNAYGFVPVNGENRYAVGPYVTGDHQAGIRNYGMNVSPLNFSDVGYDFVCNNALCPLLTQVHADGEIWSAVNFAIRRAMNARYDGQFPSSDKSLQLSCAEGKTPVNQCPGNRRWIQLMFDAWLLIGTSTPTMLDARDAMIASDMTRFGGTNQDLLWNTFASRGFGSGASQGSSEDADPVPSFESPYATEATVTFRPVDLAGNPISGAQVFVGKYEARVTPVADTDPATPLGDTIPLVAGTYEFLVRANGFGAKRFSLQLKPGMVKLAEVSMPPNLASASNGAVTTGDGTNLSKLIDDRESTNWASLGSPVAGKQVTVRLDPSRQSWQVARIQVSAQLRTRLPADPGGDTGTQSRFSALRAFRIYTCLVKAGVTCTNDADFTLLFESPADVFPSVVPRPRAPDLMLQSFVVPKTAATYVRLVVVSNQCTGTPAYQGDQDDDPGNVTDCRDGSTQDDNVRAAELQVFMK
jgi:extracellular elastinolytic metalloproteinase